MNQDNKNSQDQQNQQSSSFNQELEQEKSNQNIETLDLEITDLKKQINQLEQQQQQKDQEYQKLLRIIAENENIKRKLKEEVDKTSKFAIQNFVSDLVPIIENFFLAANNPPSQENQEWSLIKSFIDAMFMTQKDLLKILEKNQVTRINPINQAFDLNYHEAIAQIEDGNHEEGTIINVIQAGYKIADRLIKPALVAVAKKPNS